MKYLKQFVSDKVKGRAMGFSPYLSAGLANKNCIIYNYVYIIHMWEYLLTPLSNHSLPVKA